MSASAYNEASRVFLPLTLLASLFGDIMLDIYQYDQDNSQFNKVSKNGLQTAPVQTVHDGTNGETVEAKLYLRNDDDTLYYTDISLVPLPARKVRVNDLNYPEAFITFKIIAQDGQPTVSEWLSVESGNTITFDDIGAEGLPDISYKPFWVQITIPAGTRVQTINDIVIHKESKSNPVTP